MTGNSSSNNRHFFIDYFHKIVSSFLPLSSTVNSAGDGVGQILRSQKNRLSETEKPATELGHTSPCIVNERRSDYLMRRKLEAGVAVTRSGQTRGVAASGSPDVESTRRCGL